MAVSRCHKTRDLREDKDLSNQPSIRYRLAFETAWKRVWVDTILDAGKDPEQAWNGDENVPA